MLLDSSLNALLLIYFQSIVFHTSGAKENFTISVKNKLNCPNIYFLRKTFACQNCEASARTEKESEKEREMGHEKDRYLERDR